MKAFVNKVETLSDQSVKLSLYVSKELAQSAFPLAYKEVTIKEYEATDVNKDAALHLACESIKRIEEMLISELIDIIEPNNAERMEEL